MSVPIPGSRYDRGPDDDGQLARLQRELIRLRRALATLRRWTGDGEEHPRGIYVRHDEMRDVLKGDA